VRPEAKVAKPFEVGPAVEFNGDLIRQVRMARGISLVQLAEKTRISVRHLENLEADRYDSLPAAVYLRGILVSVARELSLDGPRVARSYLSFVEARRSKG
jgi:cytoskeletal protein RodZ